MIVVWQGMQMVDGDGKGTHHCENGWEQRFRMLQGENVEVGDSRRRACMLSVTHNATPGLVEEDEGASGSLQHADHTIIELAQGSSVTQDISVTQLSVHIE